MHYTRVLREETISAADLSLYEFRLRPALVTQDHTPQRPRYPAIDAHNDWHFPSPPYPACQTILEALARLVWKRTMSISTVTLPIFPGKGVGTSVDSTCLPTCWKRCIV